jgi:hypothetical protein
MRIKGLVKAFNHVRSQLQGGINPEQIEPFRTMVRAIVRDVEDICRQHGTTTGLLPAPSRMAYIFLKELDLDNLPLSQGGERHKTGSDFRVKNVVRIGEYFAERLWQRVALLLTSPNEIASVKREINEHVSSIERICELHNATPSVLESRSRQTYCWLKFISSGDNLIGQLETLRRARALIDEYQPLPSHPVHLHLIVMNALWRKRQYQDALVVKVNVGYIYADQILWKTLIQNAVSNRSTEDDHLIGDYALSDDFGDLLFEIESFASPPALPAKGRAHDLDESFERVNKKYFDSRLSKPNIVWNRTLTMRKFGHYQPARDTLMLSISLDDARVPSFVIDFVMYHELLHKKHGASSVNGRRQAHNSTFRAEERLFSHFSEATRHLHRLALKQRGFGMP